MTRSALCTTLLVGLLSLHGALAPAQQPYPPPAFTPPPSGRSSSEITAGQVRQDWNSTPRVSNLQQPQRPWANPAVPDARPTGIPTGDVIDSTRVIARIGDQIILASEILPVVENYIAKNRDQIPPDQFPMIRQALMQQAFEQMGLVERKLVLVDAMRNIPAEALENVRTQVDKEFESSRIKSLMEATGARSRAELDAKLRESGTSLDDQRRRFFEVSVVAQWRRQVTKINTLISHAEMLSYYQEHLPEFEHPARARWERLMVSFGRYPSDLERQRARDQLARMGNDVLRGVPFAEVAKAASEGPYAQAGGYHDWTARGGALSEVLEQAIFGLPVGQLSPILEDDEGVHIVRVIEREDYHVTPFHEAQPKIREAIEDQRREAALQEYLGRLRKEIHVWTIFDDTAGLGQGVPASLPSTTR